MLRWIILVVAVVFLTGAATLVVQYLPDSDDAPKVPVVEVDPNAPQPKMEIDEPLEYDFGKMAKFEEASRDWVVKNTGDAPLKINLHGNTTCSCTVSRPGVGETLVVEPGKSEKIGLNWHTNKNLPEDYSQGATFDTNDPRKPSFMLAVKGKVYPAVVVYPPDAIQFPRISNEEPVSTKIAIYSKERPDLKITEITSTRPGLLVGEAKPMTDEEAKGLKVDRGYIVNVTVKPGMPLGHFFEKVIIKTDHPKMPQVEVAVGGSTFGPISVTPEAVRMVQVSGARGATKDLTLVVRGDSARRIEVAKKPGPLEVAITRDENSKLKGRYRMTVKVPPGTASGTVAGDIVLTTDNPKASEIKIPVSILIVH